MIRDGLVDERGAAFRWCDPDINEPLVNITEFGRPDSSLLAIDRVVFKQTIIMAKVRTAPGGVRDNRIQTIKVEGVNVPTSERTCCFEIAVVGMQRTATVLIARGFNRTGIFQESEDCVLVDVRKEYVLHTTREQAHTMSCAGGGFFNGTNPLVRMEEMSCRRLGFEPTKVLREETNEIKTAHDPLRSRHAVQPHAASEQLKKPWPGEDTTKDNGSNSVAIRSLEHSGGFRLRARHFEEVRIVYPGRAGGLASETTEAIIHFLGKNAARLQPVIGDRAHEGDSPSRTVPLQPGLFVSRAGGEAKTAMHALLKHGVVERLEKTYARGLRDFGFPVRRAVERLWGEKIRMDRRRERWQQRPGSVFG